MHGRAEFASRFFVHPAHIGGFPLIAAFVSRSMRVDSADVLGAVDLAITGKVCGVRPTAGYHRHFDTVFVNIARLIKNWA